MVLTKYSFNNFCDYYLNWNGKVNSESDFNENSCEKTKQKKSYD